MSDVIRVEFGKEDREHVRRFARLMGILEDRHEDILRDPIKHIELASERIARLHHKIERARDAWRGRNPVRMYPDEIPSMPVTDTIVVPRQDWEALRQMRDIINGDE